MGNARMEGVWVRVRVRVGGGLAELEEGRVRGESREKLWTVRVGR